MEKFKIELPGLIQALLVTTVVFIFANALGEETLTSSIPGMLLLAVISLIGYFLSYVIPLKKVTSVLWISIIAILAASPI